MKNTIQPQGFILGFHDIPFLRMRRLNTIISMVSDSQNFILLKLSLRCTLLAILLPFAAVAQNGMMAGVPSSLTVHEGQNFEITWFIYPGTSPVSAVDFVLSYNPQEIEATEILKPNSPLSIQPIKPNIDNERGKIIYSAFKLDSPWPSQPFIFVGVRFKALQATAITTLFHNLEELPNSTMAFEGNMTMKEAQKVLVRILDSDTKPVSSAGRGNLIIDYEKGAYADATVRFTPSESGNATLSLISEGQEHTPVLLYAGQVIAGVDYLFTIPVKVLPAATYVVELRIGSKVETLTLRK